jgi:ribonucleoside-diphosphate reductase alpha chain
MVRDLGSEGTSGNEGMAVLEGTMSAKARQGVEIGVEKRSGLRFPRLFTRAGVHPFDEVEWELRSAAITNENGKVVFEQKDVEFPKFWSQMATNVVTSKYFRGQVGTPQRERSVKQLIGRVAKTIAGWGRTNAYFATEMDAQAFEDELTHILLHQKGSFNSPVWFNCGVEEKPQCSACFINSVGDTMEGILNLAKTEGLLFKWGSGTGTNFSALRSSREAIGGGGTASGPVSFMKGFDAFAGVIKSGGRTRRAAKMVILNADHPDIVDYIKCKAEEEKKAWTLIDAGYDASLNGPAYASIFFQNSNNSVRVTDEFMKAVEDNADWVTHAVTDGRPMDTYKARDLMDMICDAAHQCGDPGLQFDTTINDWHTCPNTARINASNPCVTGDTLVATADGLRRIEDLVGGTARVIGADGAPHLVTNIFPTGTKQVYRLRSRAGYEVRLTADHKVLTTNRGDVAAKDLQAGDGLMLQPSGFGRRALGDRLALAVGVALGDGCLTRSHSAGRVQEIVTLTMSADEDRILSDIAGAVNAEKRLQRAVGAVGRADDVHVRVAGSTSRLSFSSQPVVDAFKEIAVLDEGSDGKRLTDAGFDLDRPSTAALLRGLFSSDGTVANYGEKSQYVALDSSSLELLQQVQLLLLSFGIKAKLYTERRGGVTSATLPDGRGGSRVYPVKEMHSLRISRSSRLIFEREIGFHPQSPKAAALRSMNDEFATYRDNLTDEIESIEPLGEEPVFDLTEPVTSHFVANGLVIHNCSEYMFLDDSACNLASVNLMKFVGAGGAFDVAAYKHACGTLITAQEIIVDNASYPTPKIEKNSHDFRPLGLGYANLGALLMSWGVPYDSAAGRAVAGALTALMHGHANATSARIAAAKGPFAGFEKNREPMLRVIRKHHAAVDTIEAGYVPAEIMDAVRATWEECEALGIENGYRNSQVTVIAPTGTIAFMMDCDTTGIEPDIALVKYKKLAGGGMLKIVNLTVPEALRRLGYGEETVNRIVRFIDEHETIEGAPGLKEEHLPVFDCAFKPRHGVRSIHYLGHIRMMEAVQPFISGAISKTVNMPEDATARDIADAYFESWKGGLKAVAVYRDGSKRSQPLSTSKEDKGAVKAGAPALQVVQAPAAPKRRRLPDERKSITHKFSVAGHDGYLTVGMYEDGAPGEIFIVMAKAGSTLSGVMDSFATAVSLGLQHGVPLELYVSKFAHVRFEPHGFTKNSDIPIAKSIVDYIFRWLGIKFLGQHPASAMHEAAKDDIFEAGGVKPVADTQLSLINGGAGNGGGTNGGTAGGVKPGGEGDRSFVSETDAPPCSDCGSIMVRRGACYACINCGTTSGCS